MVSVGVYAGIESSNEGEMEDTRRQGALCTYLFPV